MELSSLLNELRLSSSASEEPLLSPALPPITELLSRLQEKLIGLSCDSEKSSLISQVQNLFLTADPDWLFSAKANQNAGQLELQEAFVSLISTLIGCVALPLCEDDCSSLPASAYQSIPSRAELVCSALTALLRTLGNRQVGSGLLLAMAPPICVFAVTHFQDQVWTSSSSRKAAHNLQEALLRAGGWRDPPHLLMGDKGEEEGRKSRGIVGGVLDILQPQLTKEKWYRCEAVKLVFAWTLLQVTRPSLSPHLPRLLPPSLLFNDHVKPENCILGVSCLHHIVLNTPAADLGLFNRAEVIYQALFKHMYTSEAAIIQPVLLCLLDLLLVLEKSPSSLTSSSSPRKPCRHDDVLRLFLTHMEAEHKVALRRVYASALPLYIDRMGVSVCRHLRRLERVVLGYLEIRDPPEETSRLKILEALQKTIRAAWPRMVCRVSVLLRCLLKLLLDVSSDSQLSDSIRQELMNQTTFCIKQLDMISNGDLQPLLQQVDSSCCSSEVLSYLATITTTT
ncbi:LOW QUALITY PROTEIN: TELO2-interacting protein 2-like [Xyrichtys novacula]|uniref:LOW QUALITY PROTEIN: TELO2-interacting protein 2-like n=1 Tax=Xyrichtys novacula TaxID=13765 RepID=A0AAV1G6C5_XYRNO|nr:LOW QUALITY PROTEIN: TELO2-interacting protein 2-like [Xyrichtys novacula]